MSRMRPGVREALFLAGLASILLLGVACASDQPAAEEPDEVVVEEPAEPAPPLVGNTLRPDGRWCASGRALCFIDLEWREYSEDIAFGTASVRLCPEAGDCKHYTGVGVIASAPQERCDALRFSTLEVLGEENRLDPRDNCATYVLDDSLEWLAARPEQYSGPCISSDRLIVPDADSGIGFSNLIAMETDCGYAISVATSYVLGMPEAGCDQSTPDRGCEIHAEGIRCTFDRKAFEYVETFSDIPAGTEAVGCWAARTGVAFTVGFDNHP